MKTIVEEMEMECRRCKQRFILKVEEEMPDLSHFWNNDPMITLSNRITYHECTKGYDMTGIAFAVGFKLRYEDKEERG